MPVTYYFFHSILVIVASVVSSVDALYAAKIVFRLNMCFISSYDFFQEISFYYYICLMFLI